MSHFIKGETKIEKVARERVTADPAFKADYVDRGVAWSKAFNARTQQSENEYDEKAFVDSLCEED